MVIGELTIWQTDIVGERTLGEPSKAKCLFYERSLDKLTWYLEYLSTYILSAISNQMKFGEGFSTKYDLSSLKVLGTVGEPINPEAWYWYHKYVGNEKAAIVDTYWQVNTYTQLCILL